VTADPDRLGQVVANLVENASTFAARQITVGAGRDGGAVVVWVVDDGPGISADELPRVFDRHFTSDRSAGRRKGSGLGLAIVAELVAAMGGTVTARSPVSDGHGTRMDVRLPAGPAPSTGPAVAVPVP
jgi:signal transduction histidine kinase